jgi:hypothetical protein
MGDERNHLLFIGGQKRMEIMRMQTAYNWFSLGLLGHGNKLLGKFLD